MKKILAAFICAVFAPIVHAAPLIPIQLQNGVSVERDLVTRDGHYLLFIRTGTWNIGGTMLNRANNHVISFIGTQKGYVLTLRSEDSPTQPKYIYTGTLNLTHNRIDGVLTHDTQNQTALTFEPYIPINNRPAFQFKFFGEDRATGKTVTQVQVLSQGKVVQTLSGFAALADEATYADYNFDGYFDLRLKLSDTVSQYWLYDAPSKQFIRDDLLSQMQGTAIRYPQKFMLQFGDIVLEKRGNTWRQVPCCETLK